MDDDAPRVTRMPGPVRPQWGELDAVLRRVLADGGDLAALLEAADDVADLEDLDPRRARERAQGLWDDERGVGDDELGLWHDEREVHDRG